MGQIKRERLDILEERDGTDLKSRMGRIKRERWDWDEFKEKDGIYLRRGMRQI